MRRSRSSRALVQIGAVNLAPYQLLTASDLIAKRAVDACFDVTTAGSQHTAWDLVGVQGPVPPSKIGAVADVQWDIRTSRTAGDEVDGHPTEQPLVKPRMAAGTGDDEIGILGVEAGEQRFDRAQVSVFVQSEICSALTRCTSR